MNYFHVYLEARNPEKQLMRSYKIDAAKDLFGMWMVEIRYGRIGTFGRLITHSAPDEAGVIKIIKSCLSRRSTAPQRIGAPYQILECLDPNGWIKRANTSEGEESSTIYNVI